jgi:hypothetical protein
MPDPSTPHARTAFRSALRKAAYDLPSPPAVTDLDAAVRLLEEALHLLTNGEFAPGGYETWPRWIVKTEEFLRGLLPPEAPTDSATM